MERYCSRRHYIQQSLFKKKLIMFYLKLCVNNWKIRLRNKVIKRHLLSLISAVIRLRGKGNFRNSKLLIRNRKIHRNKGNNLIGFSRSNIFISKCFLLNKICTFCEYTTIIFINKKDLFCQFCFRY